MPEACPEALNQDATNPDHLEEKIREERRSSEDWKKVYSTGWQIKRKVREDVTRSHVGRILVYDWLKRRGLMIALTKEAQPL
ncbi:hypothetical protein Tco_0838642 [Tanacetum coccineum]|uniref:Uncharacterized protein n=1 Tax=Tanacetum coccineum TaxID=301880 RepID=A0ABQ5ANC9_9ASTR